MTGRRLPSLVLFAALLGCAPLAGCAAQDAKAAASAKTVTAGPFLEALKAEQANPDDPEPYLAAIEKAVDSPSDPDALAALVASLDALVERAPPAPIRMSAPVAHRSREGFQKVVLGLRSAWEELEETGTERGPLMRMQLAKALHKLALFTGETKGAQVWWSRRGCLPAATVVGPLNATPLTALEGQAVVKPLDALGSAYAGPSRFAPAAVARVASDACEIDARQTSRLLGSREIVVDVENPKEQRLGFAVTSSAAAVLEVGGVRVLERRYESGGAPTLVMGHAEVPEGTVRVVLRLADKGDASPVEVAVVDDNGLPLASKAPKPGEKASVKAKAPQQVSFARGGETDERLATTAAALLATGEPRRAEQILEKALLDRREGRDPGVLLLWTRAMEMAGDMPDSKRIERTKSALDDLAKSMPASWEARLARAELAQRRKGFGEGTFTALEELGFSWPGADLKGATSMEMAYVVGLAEAAGMSDLAERAYGSLAARAPGAPLTAQVESQIHRRSGVEYVKEACEGGLARDSLGCSAAKEALGDRAGALAEIARLRELRSAPGEYLTHELRLKIASGDDKGALAVYDAMQPGERSLMTILPVLARMPDRAKARARVLEEAVRVPDGAFALSRAGLFFGEPSADARRLETEGLEIVGKDRKQQKMPGAATAVLRHVEHYGVDDTGLVRVLVYDLRRVSGTSDVERGIFVEQPTIDGRGFTAPLRRRVHKRDGRILEPDQANQAAQGGSDLSQLEQGDYVEHVMEGYFLPTETGELTIDTPDLLPERTSVASAEVAIRLPEWMKPAMWTHAMLGKPKEEARGGYRFYTFQLENQAPRRIEDGLPWLERGVRVSLGTQTWEKVGRAIGENIRSMDETDPFMARFARDASKDGTGPKRSQTDLVSDVVEHVGKVIKVTSGGSELGDFAGYYGGGAQQQTARSMVEEGTGSRTWVIYRTLRELGVDADVAVAETEPFSAAPNFPPHPGRFRKPLLVARTDKGDVWIDADVQGPPLPPGRVSPELRGRSAILGTGAVVPVPIPESDPVDEAAIDLVLDAQGTAKGKVSLTLRGQEAQGLAEAFFYVVGDDRREMLRSVVQSWLPWASVDDVRLVSKEGSWEIALTAEVTIPGFGNAEGKDGKTWALPGFDPAKSGTLAQRYASRLARQSALTIDMPIQYRVKRTIKLPAGATVIKLAPEIEKKGAHVMARRKASAQGDTITEEFTMTLPTGTVGADRYRAFLDDVQSVDAGFLAAIRVRAKP
jgi:hypothetical protein